MNAAGPPSRHEAARRVKASVDTFLAGDPDRTPALFNHNHRLDDHGRGVLTRLASVGLNSDRITAAQAIALAVPEAAWAALFADCIIAEWKTRSHKEWISNSQTVSDRSLEADDALKQIERFLGSSRGDSIEDAIALLRTHISIKRQLASEHLELYSRKTTNEASRAVGVGWIRDTLESIARQHGCPVPDPQHVAVVATVALGRGDVTPDAARKAPSFKKRLLALHSGAFTPKKSHRTRRINR